MKGHDGKDIFFVDRVGSEPSQSQKKAGISLTLDKQAHQSSATHGNDGNASTKKRKRKRKRAAAAALDDGKGADESGEGRALKKREGGEDEGVRDVGEEGNGIGDVEVVQTGRTAWVDSDDENREVNVGKSARLKRLRRTRKEKSIEVGEYNKRIREHYESVISVGKGHWAMLPSEKRRLKEIEERNKAEMALYDSDDSHSENEVEEEALKLMRSTGEKDLGIRSKGLAAGSIGISKVPQANYEDPCQAVVRAVDFHPSGEILLTGSQDRTLRLFQVDERKSTKIQGVHLRDLPIHDAKFVQDGRQIVCAGPRSFFYTFDMTTGSCMSSNLQFRLPGINEQKWAPFDHFEMSKSGDTLAFWRNKGDGTVVLMDPRSRLQTGTLQNSTTLGSLAFSNDSQKIYTTDRKGMVRIWDVRMEACVSAHVEQSGLHGLCVSASPQGYYACGSDSGVTSIYKESDPIVGGRRDPIKSIMNLSTKLKFIKFNHDGALMAIGSSTTNNAVRLVHTKTWRVYDNFPRSTEHLRKVNCLAFSRHRGFMAIGNDTGRVCLYKIHAYQNS